MLSLSAVMTSYSPTMCSLLLTLVVGCLLVYAFYFSTYPLPPGPPAKPFTGNLHQLPKSEFWKTYKQWSDQYGPVILLRIFGRKVIILNTIKAANDLLESRSNQYSDRPQAWMYKELVGRKLAVFNISSQHPRFKIYRKLLHSGLNARAVKNYYPLFEEESQTLLTNLAQTPEDFISHLRRNAGAIIMKLSYGWTVDGPKDRFVTLMENAFVLQSQITKPGRWLVDTFPFLRFIPSWFPGGDFKRKAVEFKKEMDQVDVTPFVWAKQNIISGSYTPSFTSQHLLPEDGHIPNEDEEDIIKWCSGALYAGGADTTVAFMTAFFAAMTLYPEVQERAQAEIEEVLGRDRQFHADDEASLVYTSALIKEILRWAPPAPLGLPHRVTQDDIYLGHRIPEGATIVANIWAMAHEEDIYSDPFSFNPERFIGPEPQMDPRKFVFGFGRRICPGAQFAEKSVFLNVVSILRTFTIKKPVDSNGYELTPHIEFTTTLTSHVKPFPCRLIQRNTMGPGLRAE